SLAPVGSPYTPHVGATMIVLSYTRTPCQGESPCHTCDARRAGVTLCVTVPRCQGGSLKSLPVATRGTLAFACTGPLGIAAKTPRWLHRARQSSRANGPSGASNVPSSVAFGAPFAKWAGVAYNGSSIETAVS